MSYLRLQRIRLVLACFLLSSLLFMQFPDIDIYVSGLFFDQTFYMRERWWLTLCHEGMVYFLCTSLAGLIGIYLFNRISKRSLWNVDGRKVCYLLLVLALGPGLIVNFVLKDNFGRARPRDIQEFGGAKIFTPAFVIATQCSSNCSFSSGEGAGAFFALALALALSQRRTLLAAGYIFGALVSLTRIAAGAHFLSDTVVSFFVMLLLTDVLYYYIVLPSAERERVPIALTAFS